MDPLTEKHFDVNPFNYVLNNPLLFVDPFGLDTFRLNNASGAIDLIESSRDPESEFDYIVVTDEKGNILPKSPVHEMAKGTLDNMTKEGEKSRIQIIETGNEEEAKKLFEFAAENSYVEFKLTHTESGRSFVTTSGDPGGENSDIASRLLDASRNGGVIENILYQYHSHPADDPRASPGDLAQKQWMLDLYRRVSQEYKNYYFKKPVNSEFKIYRARSKQYVPY